MTSPTTNIRPATPEDARRLAPVVRYSDAVEIAASSGSSPAAALLRGVEKSDWCNAVEIGGEVAALFGVLNGDPERAASSTLTVGVPWMLCAPLLFKQVGRLTFHRESLSWVDRMQADYDVLINFVDCRNTQAIKWLDRLDFVFTRLHPRYGVGKMPFIQFERFRDV